MKDAQKPEQKPVSLLDGMIEAGRHYVASIGQTKTAVGVGAAHIGMAKKRAEVGLCVNCGLQQAMGRSELLDAYIPTCKGCTKSAAQALIGGAVEKFLR